MDYWFPKDEDDALDPACWQPLHDVARIVAPDPSLPLVVPCDFILMGRVVRRQRPDIWEYKHIDTRRYLQIDDALQPYRFLAPPIDSDRGGRYMRRRGGLRAAVRALDLDDPELYRPPPCDCDLAEELTAIRAAVASNNVVPFVRRT